MPVIKLFVEGELDIALLSPVLAGSPTLQKGGSKNALKPRAITEHHENRIAAGYLRDRDFDYEPPSDQTKPVVDYEKEGIPIGWRWCRHEIENYLIEPKLISLAMKWPIAEIGNAIRNTAKKISAYEAARWTIGRVRRSLPPQYELQTRPNELSKEIELPVKLDISSVNKWASNTIDAHHLRFASVSSSDAVGRTFDDFITRFDDEFTDDLNYVLLWFSGKDILAGLADWLKNQGCETPKLFRAALRDWVIANPEQTIELLPEWSGLIDVLKT